MTFQTLITVPQLRICGLEHCHVTNGHVGERGAGYLDIHFFFHFCSHFVSEPRFIEAVVHSPIFWNSNLHGWPRVSEENDVYYLLCCQCSFSNTWPFGMFQSSYRGINFPHELIKMSHHLL